MIKTKLKICSGCGNERHIWKNHEGERFCKDCWYSKSPVKFSSHSRLIKPTSDKRKPLDQLYSKLRAEFLNKPENAFCHAKLPGCLRSTGQDLTIHHKKGRGKFYLDMTTWISLCINCHRWVEEHPAEAKEMLLSENRL